MTALSTQYALIGQRFPVDAFKELHGATASLRAERRQPREDRRWRASGEPIVVPSRFA